MKIRAAVLNRMATPRPYAHSRPMAASLLASAKVTVD